MKIRKPETAVRPILIADLVRDANGVEHRLFVDVNERLSAASPAAVSGPPAEPPTAGDSRV